MKLHGYAVILTAEQVARLIRPDPRDATGWPLLLRRLAESHEALRERVRELNREIEACESRTVNWDREREA